MVVTFSSSVAVDDDPTPVERFPAFDLTLANSQALETLRDEHLGRYGLSFTGSGLRDARSLLASIAVPRLVNGEPDVSVDGVRTAAALVQGELVTMSFTLFSRAASVGEEVVKTGVLTDLSWSGGPGGGLVQRLDLVFHEAHRLVLRAGGVVTVFTVPALLGEAE